MMMGADTLSVPAPAPDVPTGSGDDPVPRSLVGNGANRTYLPAEYESIQELLTLDFNTRVWDVEWSPNGSYLALCAGTGGGQGRFRLYSFNGTDLATLVAWSHNNDYMSVSWSPNGSHLALCRSGSGANVKIYSFDGTALSEVASTSFRVVYSLAWSPDGSYLAATGWNPPDHFSVYSFNGTALTLLDTYTLEGSGQEVVWNPEGTRLAVVWYYEDPDPWSFDSYGKAAILSFDGSSLATEWTGDMGDRAYSVDWRPDGDYVAMWWREDWQNTPVGVYHIYEDRTGRTVMDPKDSHNTQCSPQSISWSSNGHYLVYGGSGTSDDCGIASFDGSTLTSEHSWRFGGGWAMTTSWSPNGRHIAIGGTDGSRDLKVYRVDYGSLSSNDTAVMDEDATKTLDVLANDRSTSGDLTITNVTDPAHGLVEITPDGRDLLYTPPANWSGNVSLTYRHSDMLDDSPSAAVNITILPVNDMPVITTADVVLATEDLLYSVQYGSTDADPDDIMTWSFETEAGWLTFDEGTGNLSGLPMNDDVGLHWVNISVTDTNATSDRHSFLLRVLNVNDDPVITSEDVTTVEEDGVYNSLYIAEDVDPTRDVIVWTLETEAEWLSMYGNHLTGTPTNDDVGDHVVNVTVSDGNGGSAWTEFTITVENTNDAPWIITTPITQVTEDEVYDQTFEAEDVDVGDDLSWSLVGPDWLTIDGATGALSGTPSNDEVGTFWIVVTVTDGIEEDMVDFMLTVENVNDAPVWVETPSDQELMEGDLMFLDVLAEDEDGDTLTYRLKSTPSSEIAITGATGAIRWLEAVPGTYEVEVTASDGTVKIAHVFNVTVEAEPEPPANKVPVIGEVGAVNVTAGEAFHLKLVGSDGDEWDTVNLTFTLVNGPEGMVITSDGEILWLLGSDTVGVRYVTVELTDGKGKATLDFEVEVMEADVDDGDGDGVEDGGDYLWLVVALVVVVLLLVAVMLWQYMGQREPPVPDTTDGDDEHEDTG